MNVETIVALSNALAAADNHVEAAEAELKRAKETARRLREETIPGAMQELGITELKLESGQKLTIKQDVFAKIPDERKLDAFRWLEDNGFGGLIKVDVITNFGKGDFDAAKALAQKLSATYSAVSLKQDVHAQTLKAFLREQLAIASNIPLELFGAQPVWTAKISSK